jgi:hypothetical protein
MTSIIKIDPEKLQKEIYEKAFQTFEIGITNEEKKNYIESIKVKT